ncbi:hypothetical protein NPIL_121481, partial [Nephila pilipes]
GGNGWMQGAGRTPTSLTLVNQTRQLVWMGSPDRSLRSWQIVACSGRNHADRGWESERCWRVETPQPR